MKIYGSIVHDIDSEYTIEYFLHHFLIIDIIIIDFQNLPYHYINESPHLFVLFECLVTVLQMLKYDHIPEILTVNDLESNH